MSPKRELSKLSSFCPIIRECWLPSLVEIGLVILEKKLFKYHNIEWPSARLAKNQLSNSKEQLNHRKTQNWKDSRNLFWIQGWNQVLGIVIISWCGTCHDQELKT